MWRIRAPLLALLLMQVVLLASAGATAVKKPLGKQDTCNMKNHMIEYLRNNGVQIYERPQVLEKACKKEWGQYGTCCELESITYHLRSKASQNQFALDDLIQEIKSATPRLVEFRQKHMANSSNLTLSNSSNQSNHHLGNGITFATAGSTQQGKTTSTTSANISLELDELQQKIHSREFSLINNQKKCLKRITAIVSQSTCKICSGRADEFFDSHKKQLKVSESLCRSVLSDCTQAWHGMIKMAASIRKFTSLIRNATSFADDDGFLEESGFTMKLDGFIKDRNLIPIIAKCREHGLDKCPFQHVAALCEQFIHIQAPTYIESGASHSQKLLNSIKAANSIAGMSLQIAQKFARKTSSAIQIMKSQSSSFSFSTAIRLLRRINYIISLLTRNWMSLQLEMPVLKNSMLFKKTDSKALEKALRTSDEQAIHLENQISDLRLIKYEYCAVMLSRFGKSFKFTQKQMLSPFWDMYSTAIRSWNIAHRSRYTEPVWLKIMLEEFSSYSASKLKESQLLSKPSPQWATLKIWLKNKVFSLIWKKLGQAGRKLSADESTSTDSMSSGHSDTIDANEFSDSAAGISYSQHIDQKPQQLTVSAASVVNYEINIIKDKLCFPCLSVRTERCA